MGEKRLLVFFSGSIFDHAVQRVDLSIFHQALINIVQQTRSTFDLDRGNPWPLLFAPTKAT